MHLAGLSTPARSISSSSARSIWLASKSALPAIVRSFKPRADRFGLVHLLGGSSTFSTSSRPAGPFYSVATVQADRICLWIGIDKYSKGKPGLHPRCGSATFQPRNWPSVRPRAATSPDATSVAIVTPSTKSKLDLDGHLHVIAGANSYSKPSKHLSKIKAGKEKKDTWLRA